MIPINKAVYAKEITFIKEEIQVTGKLLEMLVKLDFLFSNKKLFG
jgi:hypothetical protein